MRLTMLGVGEAFDGAEASSAGLVEAEGFTLLIDCGHSAVRPLWCARPDPDSVEAIYLTHHHADHVLGLVPVMDHWAWRGRRAPLTVLTTAAGIGHLEQLFAAMDVPRGADCPFAVTYLVAAETAAVGPFALSVAPTRHTVPNQAVRLEAGGRVLAYSGDGRPTPESRALFRGADLVMHECFEPLATPENPFHCDLPEVETLEGAGRIGLYHVRAGKAGALRGLLPAGGRLFVAEAGVGMEV